MFCIQAHREEAYERPLTWSLWPPVTPMGRPGPLGYALAGRAGQSLTGGLTPCKG